MTDKINIFLRQYFLSAILISGMIQAGLVFASDDVITRAMSLYERHHYEEALRLMRTEGGGMVKAQQPSANLALGICYLGSANLYRELHKTALIIELDYLSQLGRQKTGARSRFVELYLGQAILESGKPIEGADHIRKFAQKTGNKPDSRNYSEIELGIAYSQMKQGKKADQIWSNLDLKVPENKAALAGAYAVAGKNKFKPADMADAALAEVQKLKKIPDARMVRDLLRAYSQIGATDKALNLLDTYDINAASHIENLGTSKTIRYYDLSLMKDVASTHLAAAIKYLESASHDTKLSGTAAYFLTEAYLQQGNGEATMTWSTNVLTQAKMSTAYKDVTKVRQVSAYHLTGRQDEAQLKLDSLAEKSTTDPLLLAAALQECIQVKMNCAKIEKIALNAVDNGEGKKFFSLNAALGKYYLSRKDYSKAVLYMEAGRDKANKNKIEANDPVMLVNLAEAYYRNKKFSENLEIYFELSKQFPLVRQIQEAMQGIYSMEQQSAGEVKIY